MSQTLDPEQLLTHATEFKFLPAGAEPGQADVDHFSVRVSLRGPGRYAVVHMGSCWDGKEWVYESLPSNRTDAFKMQSRFPLDEAVELARELVDTVRMNGGTWAQWQERFAQDK